MVKQKQSQKQVVIVNVGTTKKRKGGGKRRAKAPAVMIQQVIPPIPLSVQQQPQADFASQFMKVLAGMGEGMTVKRDTIAPQVTLNNPNNAKIAQEQEEIQRSKGFPSFKAEEDDFNVKNLRDIQQQMLRVQNAKEAMSPGDTSPYSYSMYGTPDLATPMSINTPPGVDLWSSWRGQPLTNQPSMPSQSMSSSEAIKMYGPPIGMPETDYKIKTGSRGGKYKETEKSRQYKTPTK
jgi:hypothetical protein